MSNDIDTFVDGKRLRGDVKLFFDQTKTEHATIDIDPDTFDLYSDAGLENAVLISLFTDKRADDDDELPDVGNDDRRGWWGDALRGWKIGSKLWLLAREKCLDTLGTLLEQYSSEALQWLVSDGVAESVSAEASRTSKTEWSVQIKITRPQSKPMEFIYFYNWQGQIFRGQNVVQ